MGTMKPLPDTTAHLIPPQWPTYVQVTLPVLIVVLVALIPRTVSLNDFFTFDEAYHWIGRTERFFFALIEQSWAETRQTGHPGVTLMWLGSLGLALEHATEARGWYAGATQLDHLTWMRLPSALLHSLLVATSFVLLRRLVQPTTALIAVLLWATCPFLIAHARLLHLDALLTDFVSFSLLCLLIACRTPQRLRWLAISGGFAGLALLTKGPALIELPAAGLLLLWHIPVAGTGQRLRSAVSGYMVWLAAALLVVVLCWPALWITPGLALERYIEKIIFEGGNPFVKAQFFFGRTVTDPGPLFYPVASLFRMTPVTTLGLLMLPLALRRAVADRSCLLALAAFVLFWALIMTSGPKKFDRYLLPVWPSLLVLAAAGWAALFSWLRQIVARRYPAHIAQASTVIGMLLLVAATIQPLIIYHPYYLGYYNPLSGGGAAAQHILLIGWGEGNDQIGAYLRSRTDIEQGHILTTDTRLLRPFVPVPVTHITQLGEVPANYVVFDRASIQRNTYPALYEQVQQTEPLHNFTLHGIDYAEIYQVPRPFDKPVVAQFGDALRLHGITVTRQPEAITVTPSWDVRHSPAADYWVFLHLVDAQGQVVAQTDTPPGGADTPPTSGWERGQQIAVPLPLVLPDLPPGEYRLLMGLYDVASGERVPLTEGQTADPTLAGEHALLLEQLWVP